MSSQPGPWSSQPGDPATSAPRPDWAQAGPAGWVPPAPVYGPVPTHYSGPNYSGPAGGYSSAPPPYVSAPGHPAAPGYPPPPSAGYAVPLRTDYARWGKRVGAMLIDHIPTYIGLIIFCAGYFAWLLRFSTTANTGSPDLAGGLVPMIVGFAIMLAGFGWSIYNRWLVGGRTGQSLGKRVTKIRLIGELTDAPIGPTNAFVRDLVHILDGIVFVGYLWPLWDDKRQTFSDNIMRTIVVNAS